MITTCKYSFGGSQVVEHDAPTRFCQPHCGLNNARWNLPHFRTRSELWQMYVPETWPCKHVKHFPVPLCGPHPPFADALSDAVVDKIPRPEDKRYATVSNTVPMLRHWMAEGGGQMEKLWRRITLGIRKENTLDKPIMWHMDIFASI